jgi:outer membrane protein OmpA-like peptidoglycan-associated protein
MRPLMWTGSVILLSTLAGCATKQPSQQLVDARMVVSRASEGRAAQYAPDDLLKAKALLGQAEQVSDGSPEEVQYAYLADRAARRATSNGSSSYFLQQEEAANAKYHSLQESGRLSAEDELEKTRRDLAEIERRMQEKDANVDELRANKAALEAQQARLQGSLVSSEKARLAAEARATAAIASLTALGNVREEENTTILTLSGSVLFKTGEATLLPIAQDSLKRVAEALLALPEERTIVVEGHTDSQGQDDANQRLSQSRAQAVVTFLSGQGVASGRLSAVGRGEAEPVASNANAEGRANNRRVELVIQNAGPRPVASR